MTENYVNESLQFALQAIRDEATKPLHVEIEALRARVAEARALLDRATQFLGAEKGGTEYKLFSDIEDWLYPSAGNGLSGNKPASLSEGQ